MRALPVIVDLFVLLTMVAFVLFFAALGNSAPNEPAQRLAFFEVEAIAENSTMSVPADTVGSFRAELVDAQGRETSGSVMTKRDPDNNLLTFFVRDAPDEASLRVVVDRLLPEAFEYQRIRFRMKRRYPGPVETREYDGVVGQIPIAVIPVSKGSEPK